MIRKIAAAVAMVVAAPASAQSTSIFLNLWNPAVQLTAEQKADVPTADIASTGWLSADWVIEPAPGDLGQGAVLLRNAWRNSYLTYDHEWNVHESTSNARLLPKIEAPKDRRQTMLRQGQAWMIEDVPSKPGAVRLRTAYSGFGMAYLTISHSQGKFSGFKQPFVAYENNEHAGAMWIRARSNKTDQQQCVKNMSVTVFDVEWYQGRDVTLSAANGTLSPTPNGAPQLSERKSLGFSSCENSNQRMVAVIRLYGKNAVTSAIVYPLGAIAVPTGTFFTPVGAAAAFAGVAALDKYLRDKPDTAYIGVPGKISVNGTLFDASVTVEEPLKF